MARAAFRLFTRPGAGQKAGVTNEPSTARRWRRLCHPGWWLLALALAGCAWLGWRSYDKPAAIRQAKAAGWHWQSRNPVSIVLADWRAAGQKETWTVRYSRVDLPMWTDLASARPLLDRLRPTMLVASECPDKNLDALRGLSGLQNLGLLDCTNLQNVDALRGFTALQTLDLSGCTGLQNVDGLRSLPALHWLCLRGCTAIPASALRDLEAALPKTAIIVPNSP